ncbi:MAG: ABC transporter substrate-binding protein [Anaerolineae bacterium]|nr:ABC transporter substrate-binding protein [Anaerolineae bacterium]
MSKKMGLLMSGLLVVVMLVGAVGPLSAQDPVTFVWGAYTNPVQLYAAVVTDGVSFTVLNQGCESLMGFDGATTNAVPSLATELTANDDLTVWTAKLREGVTFHDGTPFNAEAVVFNFEAWRNTDNPLHFESQVYEYYGYMFDGFDDDSLIASIDVVDDYTVQFNLTRPYVQMPNTLAMPMFQINSPAALEQYGEDYGTPNVGYVCTGPYQFVEWVTDDHVTQDLYEGYWGEVEGNVERIIQQVIPDNAARFAALQSGAIHAKENATPEELAIIETSDEMYLSMRPALNVMYLAFNYRIKEFNNPLVREAISLALNRQAYVDAFYPAAEVANTFLPPLMWGYNPDVPMPEWNPDRAIELLAEAGYPDGFSEVTVLPLDDNGQVMLDAEGETMPLTLYWQPAVRPYNPDGEGIGQAMAADLAMIGIDVQLDNAGDWATYLDLRRNGNLLGLYQLGWTGDNGDPDNFSGYFFKNCNEAQEGYFNFPEICETLTEAGNLVAQSDRAPLYAEADAMLAETVGRINVAHSQVPLVFRSNVSGYIPNPLGTELFRYITIE